MGKLTYSPAAREDLLAAALNLLDRSGSIEISERFTRTVDEKVALLVEHPLAGEACPVYRVDGMRQFPVREFNYVIFYRSTHDGVQILRIVHGSRDIPSIFRH